MVDIVNPSSLNNNVSSIDAYNSAVAINKLANTAVITMADEDYIVPEDEHGYGSYYFITTAISEPREVLFDDAYAMLGNINVGAGYGSDTIDVGFDGWALVTIPLNSVAGMLVSNSFGLFALAGVSP